MSFAPGTPLGPYEIVEPLGAGGMGEVYRARDTKLDRHVAIKVLPPTLADNTERLARFEREARSLAALNHPNIAAIYGLEDRAIVMELVEGPTLADRLKSGPLPLDEALGVARQIADALEAAHEKGIVHRDLKPANIKAPLDAPVKVLDFGLATAMQSRGREEVDAADSPTLTVGGTEVGVILGTAAYMSPEQAAGKPVDRRADIWSFGVVLWEMLTGRRLFDSGETVSHTLADVLRAPIDLAALPATTPPHIRELIRRCLDRDVKTRLRDIGEARIAVTQAFLPASALPTRAVRSSRWQWAALVLLAAAAGTLAFLHFREQTPPAQPYRFAIQAPEGTTLQAITLLSPNGRRIAFNTLDKSGRARLWVQPLDSLQARVVAEIGDSSSPFWSPDSRWLAYAVDGKLKKVDMVSGNAVNLCDYHGAFRGGSWNREGTIIFGTSASAIMRVPQAGGVAQPVTELDASRDELGHMRPFFLPDGRHFLYFRLTTGAARSDNVFLGSLDATPAQQSRETFLNSDALAQYAPSTGGGPGYVLFVRDNILLAQAFDPGSSKLSGEPAPIADGINNSVSFASFSVSEDGSLAYRSGLASRRQLTWLDRKGKVAGAVGQQYRMGYSQVEFSPDGRQAAAASDGDVWVFELERDSTIRLPNNPETDRSPVWSPDSQRLLFWSGRGGIGGLYLQSANGATPAQEVAKSLGAVMDPSSWSRDGFVLYTVVEAATRADVWVAPAPEGKPDTSQGKPFLNTPAVEGQAQFSPDGRWVAYTSNESGPNEVYVRSFPDGKIRRKISEGGGAEPRWNANSREIFYRNSRGIMAVPVTTDGSLEPGSPAQLFEAPTFPTANLLNRNPVWDVHPDGKRFLVPLGQMESPEPITVLLNWQTLLRDSSTP